MSLQVATQHHSCEEFREATLHQLDYITNVQSIHFDNMSPEYMGTKQSKVFVSNWMGIFCYK